MGFAATCIYDFHFAFTQGDQPGYIADFAVILVVPIPVTNVLSTSLIAWKAWHVMWLLVSVIVRFHDKCPPPPGITTKQWVGISERVGILGAWRKFSCFWSSPASYISSSG